MVNCGGIVVINSDTVIIISYIIIIISGNETLQHNHLLLLLTPFHFALEAELRGFPTISVSFDLSCVTE